MTLDSMHLVLYAIYAEYKKDLPDMENVSAEALCMDEDVFNVAVLKLENERFITGAVFKYVDQLACPIYVSMLKVMPTEKIIDKVTAELKISARTGSERTKQLVKRFAGYGWDALTDFTAKVLVELSKQTIK